MHDRSVLGPADVEDSVLAGMVSRQLGIEAGDVQLLESSAQVAPYDIEALTTAGRYRVRGIARTPAGDQPFSFYVKVVQSWARSPWFAAVPPELREQALALLPWEVEPLVYRSDLGERLPVGLTMPTAYAVVDIDAESAALWLEAVEVDPDPWDCDRFAHAARLLGRLAGSRRVRPAARIGRGNGLRTARGYAEGRVAHQVLPALRSDDLWSHPLVAGAFDAKLRADLLAAADALPAVLTELESMPVGALHGDACTRNLLVRPGAPDLVLIDYAFWGEGPLGWDLGQLLIGEVQLGERPASELPDLEARCLAAYVDGLRQEGCDVDAATVQRAHSLQMLLFSGLSAVPFEYLDGPPTPERQRVTRERACGARFILDLVASTG